MSYELITKVCGIPTEIHFGIDPADPTVGLGVALEDVRFYNVKNGSRMTWLERKFELASLSEKSRVERECIQHAESCQEERSVYDC